MKKVKATTEDRKELKLILEMLQERLQDGEYAGIISETKSTLPSNASDKEQVLMICHLMEHYITMPFFMAKRTYEIMSNVLENPSEAISFEGSDTQINQEFIDTNLDQMNALSEQMLQLREWINAFSDL